MSMMVSFVLSFFPRDVLDEILNLIESVSEDFPSYFCPKLVIITTLMANSSNGIQRESKVKGTVTSFKYLGAIVFRCRLR